MFEVTKWKRIGLSNFQKTVSIMSKQEVEMAFPTWKGDFVHHVGKDIYHIKELE